MEAQGDSLLADMGCFFAFAKPFLVNSSTSINPAIQEDRMQKPLVILWHRENCELNVN